MQLYQAKPPAQDTLRWILQTPEFGVAIWNGHAHRYGMIVQLYKKKAPPSIKVSSFLCPCFCLYLPPTSLASPRPVQPLQHPPQTRCGRWRAAMSGPTAEGCCSGPARRTSSPLNINIPSMLYFNHRLPSLLGSSPKSWSIDCLFSRCSGGMRPSKADVDN